MVQLDNEYSKRREEIEVDLNEQVILYGNKKLTFLACVQDLLDEPLSPKHSAGECGEDYLNFPTLLLSK